MALHLVKLCVGVVSVEELAGSMAQRPRPEHITRMVPRRRDALLAGGSLYWVIRGWISARQRLLDIAPFDGDDGISRCRLVLAAEVVSTEWRPRGPFQGWRYLKPEDAPGDIDPAEAGAMPLSLRAELAELGLL